MEKAPEPFKILGSRPIAQDAWEKATGRAGYGVDIKIPGMIHGKILRSPHAHARILSIDTNRAEALAGVVAVVTWQDLWPKEDMAAPEKTKPEIKQFRDNLLASDKALYCGQAIAAVAATEPWLAEEALKRIDVVYEVLPAVLDPVQAIEKDSPILHETVSTQSLGGRRDEGAQGSNVAFSIEQLKGDPEKGFEEAEVIVEREFRVATVHQGYLEPQVTVAVWPTERNLKLRCSTQGAFYVRRDVAEALRMPLAQIKVIPSEPGGAFGGKNVVYLEPVAALLARKAGRPVRMVMTRAEVFEGTGPCSGCFIRVKMGATRQGRITAATAYMLFESGAYTGLSWAGAGARCIFAPYDIPHGRIDAYDILVNKPKSGAYRAPSATHVAFACESVIDEISEIIGMDPMEFRLKNAAKKGTRRIDGVVYPVVGFVETMEAAVKTQHYKTPIEGPFRGRGIACGWWFNAGMASTCSLGVNEDGSVSLTMGSIDLGSNARTAVAMQAAERLSIPLEDIHANIGDTDSIGYTATSGGSRTTFASGLAAIEAADELLRQMGKRAALIWDVEDSTVSYKDGLFITDSDPAKRLTFKEVSAKVLSTGDPIYVTSSIDPKGVGSVIATHIVDLEVDPETGKVTILRYTAVQDVGKAVHPAHIEGQIHGGAVQGIGRALSEDYQFDERGRMMNKSFLDYRMPIAVDVPPIETILVEVANPGHPYGVRGVAEAPVTPPPAAIAIALHRALGVRMAELPMTPERILWAMGNLR